MKALNTAIFIVLFILSIEDIRARELSRGSLGLLYAVSLIILFRRESLPGSIFKHICIAVISYLLLLISAVMAETVNLGFIGGGDLKVIAALLPAFPPLLVGRGLLIAAVLLLPFALLMNFIRARSPTEREGPFVSHGLFQRLTPYCNPAVTFPLVPFITIGVLIAYVAEV